MIFKNVLCIYPYKQELKTVGFLPPIGLEYIASSIKDMVDTIKVIDLRYEDRPLSSFIDKNTDLALLSYNWDVEAAFVKDTINSIPKDITVIIGGRYATENVNELFDAIPRINGIARGDDEEIVKEIVQKGISPDIDGLSFRSDGTIVHNVLGQGTAALGMGSMALTGRARKAWAAQSGGSQTQQAKKAVDSRWDEWEFYKPGQYNEEDTKVLNDFQAELAQLNKQGSNFSVNYLISGKLSSGQGAGPGGRGTKITNEGMMRVANINVPTNPLFTNREYAKKSKYGNPIAWPLISSLEVMPAMPKSKGIGDYMVVSAHNDTNSYYKPFYEGDTLYSITVEQHCTDITPAEGSYYRTFAMSGHAKVYNQKGELVSEAANILKESFRRHKDKSKRSIVGAHAWESPDWWSRPAHQYTDKDWENIISMWKNEKVRAAEPLYWDEVKVGDEPTPTADMFIMETEGDIAMSIPQFSIDIKKNVLDPKIFPTMVKNKQGIWVLPEYKEKKARGAGGGPMGDMPGGGQGMPQGAGAGGAPQGAGGAGGQGAGGQGMGDGLRRTGSEAAGAAGGGQMMPQTKEIRQQGRTCACPEFPCR